MTLENLLNAIENCEKLASIDLAGVPARTRVGVEGLKNSSEIKLVELRKEYRAAIKDRTLAIFLKGDNQEKFAEVANEELDTFTFDVSQMYENIAEQAFQFVDQRGRLSVNSVQEIVEIIRDEVRGSGVNSMPPPAFDADYYVKDVPHMTDIVRDAIRKAVGDELNLHYLEHKLAEKALAEGYIGDVVCVVLTGATDAEMAGFEKFGSGVAILSVPSNPNKANVTQAITKIVKKFKGITDSAETK